MSDVSLGSEKLPDLPDGTRRLEAATASRPPRNAQSLPIEIIFADHRVKKWILAATQVTNSSAPRSTHVALAQSCNSGVGLSLMVRAIITS
jgi:hypothetical protein